MKSVMIKGRFVNERTKQPVQGRIKFIPQRLWVNEEDIAYAALAPEMDLVGGYFYAQLTPTHGHDDVPWMYTVECPVGTWNIEIPESDDDVYLSMLLPSRFRST